MIHSSAIATTDGITVIDPYVRAIPPGQSISAAFLQLNNNSDEMNYLIKATSPIANVVELHEHIHDKGMMKMRRVERIEIPAKSSTLLKPGGYHIMLIDLKGTLALDQKITINLEFSDGSKQIIIAPVRKIMMKGMMKK
jgi:copper(I)-binding protein